MMTGEGPRQLLESRVLAFIEEHALLSGEPGLVVAVSGGPDSVCLLHILARLQPELDVSLHVAHLNHQLRGAESDADADYVARLAGALGIPATIEKRDVRAYRAHRRISLEEAAREVRYAFLARVARAIGARRVAVGHTVDDHVETILMHLVRGTGLRGLRGLLPSTQWQSSSESVTVIRPLLEVSRDETTAYCHDHQLEPRVDTSNLSLSPLRNRIRQQLVPLLRSYNPRVAEALIRMARLASDDLTLLEKEASRLSAALVRKEGDTAIIDREGFLNLPAALRRHLLRAVLEELLGNLRDVEGRHIEEIMSASTKPAGKRLNLPGGLVFTIEYDRYRLARSSAALCPFPPLTGEYSLHIPGETRLPGWCVRAAIMKASVAKREMLPFPSPATGFREGSGRFDAYLDLDRAGREVVVRSGQPGDRFQPLGMSQLKKLSEFMVDAKVPRAWRRRVPIVGSREHILWVVGWRIDERAKVTEDTVQVLHLTFERTPEVV